MELFRLPPGLAGSPEELLARDEALLDECESMDHPGFLTFWESSTYFVVLGYGKDLQREVFVDECARLKIPVLRRCSGGGTVVQGPGCFSYALVLPIERAAELESITATNCFIMDRIRSAVSSVSDGPIAIRGYTDLTVGDLKFCGNAQRRKRRAVLFHGSFLLNFDLPLISRILRMPEQQPEYRQKRSHNEFLRNFSVPSAEIERCLSEAWHVRGEPSGEVRAGILRRTTELAKTKYSTDEWNRRT